MSTRFLPFLAAQQLTIVAIALATLQEYQLTYTILLQLQEIIVPYALTAFGLILIHLTRGNSPAIVAGRMSPSLIIPAHWDGNVSKIVSFALGSAPAMTP